MATWGTSRDKQPDPAVFWGWFSANSARAEALIDQCREGAAPPALADVDPVISSFLEALRSFDKRLVCEFGPLDEGYDFVISADGNAAAFESVFALVKAAPVFERWRITALKPRINGAVIKLEGLAIKSDELLFVALKSNEDPEKADFVFSADCDVEANEELLHALAAVALETALGEHDAGRFIDSVTVLPAAEFAATFGQTGRPLSEIEEQFPASQTVH